MPLQNMGIQQMLVELLDYRSRGSDAAARGLLDAAAGEKSLFRPGAGMTIRDERLHAKEYVLQEFKPRFLMQNIKRPGWEEA